MCGRDLSRVCQENVIFLFFCDLLYIIIPLALYFMCTSILLHVSLCYMYLPVAQRGQMGQGTIDCCWRKECQFSLSMWFLVGPFSVGQVPYPKIFLQHKLDWMRVFCCCCLFVVVCLLACFRDRIFLCSPGCLGIYFLD